MADYPYIYARVSAKRAKLLESSDYEKLLKMGPNEIARNLEEGEYGKEINELGARHSGPELVELALNRNLSSTLSDLREMAPESLKKVMTVYLRRYDIRSLKRLLRWKKSDQEIVIEDLLNPAGAIHLEEMKQLAEMEIEQIVDSINFPDSEIDYQSRLENIEELPEIERILDGAYFDELEALASDVESQQFQKFVREELEHENIRTVLRLKRYGFTASEIENHLLEGRSDLVEELKQEQSIEDAIQTVKERKGIENGERLEDIEHLLEVKRLEKALSMLHTEPLGMTSILGYIVAKIIEVKNLRMLTRAKETGIQNLETIRANLVTS